MKIETGIPFGSIADIAEMLTDVYGDGTRYFSVENLYSYALKAETYLCNQDVPVDYCEGTTVVVTLGGEPADGQTVIGNRAILRRTETDWRVVQIGHAIRYPGSFDEFEIKLTREAKTWLRQQTALAA